MKFYKKSLRLLSSFLMVLFALCLSGCKSDPSQKDWEAVDRILSRINPPEFPDRKFLITDFGALADGSLSTDAIRKAIQECHLSGGGVVEVPADTFVTGAIHLLSNVNLHLVEGAVLKFSTNPEDYLPVVVTRSEGMELYNYSPLIYAYEQENIAVTGRGTLDGQASEDNWWSWRGREQFGWRVGMPSGHDAGSFPRLFELSEKGVPIEEKVFGEGAYLRPSFVQPYLCKNILIEGVTIINPPMWMIHPVLSENITIRRVNLFSKGAPNGDGCDPECCKDVLIEESIFNNGDDCIALKSGRNRQGYELGIPTENVVIRNCTMMDGHGGITIGSELSGGIRNIFAYNCDMSSPNLVRAIRLKSNKFRGGIIENIYFKNIRVGEVGGSTIQINQNYQEKSDVIYGPEKPTIFRDIKIDGLICGKSEYPFQIIGMDDQPVKNIEIINSKFEKVAKEGIIQFADGVKFREVFVNGNPINY